jgi:hypothetical protein
MKLVALAWSLWRRTHSLRIYYSMTDWFTCQIVVTRRANFSIICIFPYKTISSSLRSDSSSDVSTASSQSSINKRKYVGMWLNLMPPGSHSCVLCSQNFNSLQTERGYQNSDETLKFHALIHNLYLKIIKEEI